MERTAKKWAVGFAVIVALVWGVNNPVAAADLIKSGVSSISEFTTTLSS